MSSSVKLTGEQTSDVTAQLNSVREWLDQAETRVTDGNEVSLILSDFQEAQTNLDDLVEQLEEIL